MAEISAARVKELREKTSAGMMDCKRALAENDGDLEAAVDWLRKKGLMAASKKAGRVAAEGLVGIALSGADGAMVEVNAETDFVSRNPDFQAFVKTVSELALANGDSVEALTAAPYPASGRTVADELLHLIATIGENMNVRRVAKLGVKPGVLGSYVHNVQAPGLGKIGVLVALETEGDAATLDALARQIAMHVAATAPQSVSRDDLDPALVERERNILAEQARASGKPEAVIEKMVEGRLRKFYEEVCLVDQAFVMDPDKTVGKVLEDAAASAGTPVRVAGFVRFALGEGIDRKTSDFADEVARAVRK